MKRGNPTRIDAHHHFWRYSPAEYDWIDEDMASLRRDFLPSDLESLLQGAGIDGVISVQARQTVEETRWLLDLADRYDFVQGIVGWAPIADEGFPRFFEEFRGRTKLKGLRHVIQGESDDQYILKSDFNRGIHALQGSNLVYDILILERHIPQTIEFVDRHPQQVFVLDHMAKPLISAGRMEPWRTNLRELAKRENVYCKVSGMVTEADWIGRPPGFADRSLIPYLDATVEAFGPARLLAGSDWPVCLVGISYVAWFDTLANYFADFSQQEQNAVFGGNANLVYRL